MTGKRNIKKPNEKSVNIHMDIDKLRNRCHNYHVQANPEDRLIEMRTFKCADVIRSTTQLIEHNRHCMQWIGKSSEKGEQAGDDNGDNINISSVC